MAVNAGEEGGRPPAGNGAAGGATLDDLMMAMDVVDTLRHEEQLVEAELSRASRDEVLKARLREIYEGQGLEVSDRILDEGIRALKENRFVYDPPKPGLSRSLALLWVRRGRAGLAVGAALAVLVAVVGYNVYTGAAERRAERAAAIELTRTLPAALSDAAADARAIARTPAAEARIEELVATGEAALAVEDAAGARQAVNRLGDLADRLRQTYELRVVSRPGSPTGVFRIPDANPEARNFYLIVEAIGPDGTPVELPVTSEEDGTTTRTATFGIRVPAATYEAVRQDKAEDGIVQNGLVGEKPVGALEPAWRMGVEGGAITRW